MIFLIDTTALACWLPGPLFAGSMATGLLRILRPSSQSDVAYVVQRHLLHLASILHLSSHELIRHPSLEVSSQEKA
ncbi:hypothetical protein BGZ63DRAFT_396367 [Mariannaea sp. PMI_226]|nr:hypothetical protein BGZ63DRAFT_396367 [Mariannaea sp. PMI_226]